MTIEHRRLCRQVREKFTSPEARQAILGKLLKTLAPKDLIDLIEQNELTENVLGMASVESLRLVVNDPNLAAPESAAVETGEDDYPATTLPEPAVNIPVAEEEIGVEVDMDDGGNAYPEDMGSPAGGDKKNKPAATRTAPPPRPGKSRDVVVENALEQGQGILEMIEDIDEDKYAQASAFFESVANGVRGVMGSIERYNNVTPKQASALRNWERGVRGWHQRD